MIDKIRLHARGELQQRKKEHGIADRTDILTISDLMDFDEGRFAEATKTA